MALTAQEVWRDYETDGVPASGNHKSKKSEIRTLLKGYEDIMSALSLADDLQGAWDASTGSFPSGAQEGYSWIASTPGTVGGKYFGEGDQIIALVNGASTTTYTNNWVVIPAWTSGVVPATDEGAGTANAIQVTTEKLANDDTIVVFTLDTSTTNSPVTISINGGAALTLKTNRGNDASALTAGQEIWGRIRTADSTFRLLNDQDVSALVAQAEAALAEFQQSYLGAKASDPATDNEGNPLEEGALYWNSTDGKFRVYHLGAWEDFTSVPDASIGISKLANDVVILNVADRTALKAINTTRFRTAFLNEAGREGAFIFTPGDYSAETAADTAEGIYIKADDTDADEGAWVRVDPPVLSHFGGSADSDSAAAIAAMASLLGEVVVGRGAHLVNSTTISVPVRFLPGGYFTASAGQEIIFQNLINSDKQWIFRGDGSYRSDISAEIGEDSKVVHASWFGIFPVGATASSQIQTALFNKALQWFTYETREGTFLLDNGSYYIDGTITVPRGVHFKGTGTRRTIIDVEGGGFTCFEAGGDAVKITGIQNEQHPEDEGQFTGTFIDLLAYNGCEVDDVWVWGRSYGVVFGGNDCRISRIMGRYNYGEAPASGSAVVWQKSGQNARIEDIGVRGQAFATTYIVRLGDGDAASIVGTSIRTIFCGEASIPVRINASGTQGFRGITIDGVVVDNADADIAAAVDIQNSGSGTVKQVIASNIHGLNGCTNLLRIGQTGTGTTDTITLASGDVEASGSQVAALTRTAGTLRNVIIGYAVNGMIASTKVTQSGTMTNVIIPNHLT